VKKEIINIRQEARNLQEEISTALHHITIDLDETIRSAKDEIENIKPSDLEDSEIIKLSLQLEKKIRMKAEEGIDSLQQLRAQIQSVSWEKTKNGLYFMNLDAAAGIEEELLALREQADLNLELSQLGMAIEIINHEFNNSVQAIRDNIKLLKRWADINPDLLPLYNDIRNTFEHLDGYLTLFTPLHRRLRRSTSEIRGSNIVKFLKDLFDLRITRHNIDLSASRKFRNKTILGYPSTFFPVFVNLVDNSIYWLADQPNPRKITLDVENDEFIISDNGPGIPTGDREAIFEYGFTRKPEGRGLGLYISKEVLIKEGYDLVLDENKNKKGATFRITKKRLS